MSINHIEQKKTILRHYPLKKSDNNKNPINLSYARLGILRIIAKETKIENESVLLAT